MSIKEVTVVGAGVMGREIAYVFAAGGFSTMLVDVKEPILQTAEQELEKIFHKAIDKGKMTIHHVEESKRRLRYSTNLKEASKTADLVIEAVPEVMAIKKQVFEELDRCSSPHCILATNTSTMSPTELGSFTKRPEKVVAMHFFNPVHKMKLVEIAKGLETSEETVAQVVKVTEAIGKETVVINEFPGFVTSRLSALIGNEAFYMLQEGIGTPEEIDKAVKLGLNFPMGPFELGDLVGLDTRLNNLLYLQERLGEKYRPAPLLIQYVRAGRLGRKTGRGVYDYRKDSGN